jgi:hypothetical protein
VQEVSAAKPKVEKQANYVGNLGAKAVRLASPEKFVEWWKLPISTSSAILYWIGSRQVAAGM